MEKDNEILEEEVVISEEDMVGSKDGDHDSKFKKIAKKGLKVLAVIGVGVGGFILGRKMSTTEYDSTSDDVELLSENNESDE